MSRLLSKHSEMYSWFITCHRVRIGRNFSKAYISSQAKNLRVKFLKNMKINIKLISEIILAVLTTKFTNFGWFQRKSNFLTSSFLTEYSSIRSSFGKFGSVSALLRMNSSFFISKRCSLKNYGLKHRNNFFYSNTMSKNIFFV